MAYNFSAEQFDQPFFSKRIRNWEVPKWYPPRPCPRKGSTKVLVNNNGHLLPGVKRAKTSPWGVYKSTWDLPRTITREVADQLYAPDRDKVRYWEEKCRKQEILESRKFSQNKSNNCTKRTKKQEEEKICESREEILECPETKVPELKSEDDLKPYCPGDLTSPRHRHSSYEMLKSTLRPKNKVSPLPPKQLSCQESVGENLPPEVALAMSNFQIARKFHTENLEHKPLPETVTDALYRKYQLDRHPYPGVALEEEPNVTGVGYKAHGYNPTHCTKLKIYRPKTGVPMKMVHCDGRRPATSKQLTIHSILQKEVTPIELALCWDVIPENPTDEPKRTIHIDGTSDTAGPAVFTRVITPNPEPEKARVHTLTVFEKVENPQADMKPSKPEEELCSHMHGMHIKPPSSRSSKSTPNLSKSFEKLTPEYKEHFCRPCAACEMKNWNPHHLLLHRAKSEYKMAFKAGVPNNFSNSDSNSSSGRKVDVPKQRDPFVKKNYRITSLAPPFSLEPKKRDCTYPEHWRLASVYQHSYKPMHTRKRPLLASVYN